MYYNTYIYMLLYYIQLKNIHLPHISRYYRWFCGGYIPRNVTSPGPRMRRPRYNSARYNCINLPPPPRFFLGKESHLEGQKTVQPS